MLSYINFSVDFLGLDNIDFENYFANELINSYASFFKPFKALVVGFYQIYKIYKLLRVLKIVY